MQVFMIAKGNKKQYETVISEARKVARDGLADGEVATICLCDTGKLTAPRIIAIAAAMDADDCENSDALFESIRPVERHIGQPGLTFESPEPDDSVPGRYNDEADPKLTESI